MTTETEWIDVEVMALTEKAALFSNGKDQAWIPLSQVIDHEDRIERGCHVKVELPVWLLEKSGLV